MFQENAASTPAARIDNNGETFLSATTARAPENPTEDKQTPTHRLSSSGLNSAATAEIMAATAEIMAATAGIMAALEDEADVETRDDKVPLGGRLRPAVFLKPEWSTTAELAVTRLEIRRLEEETLWKMLHHDRVASPDVHETATVLRFAWVVEAKARARETTLPMGGEEEPTGSTVKKEIYTVESSRTIDGGLERKKMTNETAALVLTTLTL